MQSIHLQDKSIIETDSIFAIKPPVIKVVQCAHASCVFMQEHAPYISNPFGAR
jgi:hypothetical protein